ncbi:hypothetical protein EDC96DRAFT_443337 [Choanephora cucurbitarum]|nr:hypothetical protein EDC96DRAFT_443337 [Choanephora cucurbitarum]
MHTIAEQDEIHRVDLRVGQIVDIAPHPEASHLYIEQVDLNTVTEPNPRTIVSGLAPYMTMDTLLHKKVVVVSNLKPSKFRGILSQGMLLAATSEDGKTVRLLSPPQESQLGERIKLEGIDWQGSVTVLKPKQKVFEHVVQYLKTDQEGKASYKGITLTTSAGPIVCDLKEAQIS